MRTGKPRGRAFRYVKRALVTLFVLVVLAVATTLIALHTAWGRDKIRGEIESILADQFPGGAHVTEVEGSVLGTLVIDGIVIDGNDKAPMVTIDKLSVDVGLWSLVHKHVDVRTLVVDGVHVRIRQQPPSPPKPPEPPSEGGGSPWKVSLEDVRVTHVDVAITGVAPDTHIDDVTMVAKADIAGDQISASLDIVGAYREKVVPFALATQGFQLDGTKVTLHDLVVIAGGGIALVGNELTIDPAGQDTRPAGALLAIAPAPEIARLSKLALPGDATLSITTTRDPQNAALVDLEVDGAVGHARVLGWAHADLASHAVGGLFAADAPNLAALTNGALVGAGSIVVSAATDGASTVRGVVFANESQLGFVPPGHALVAFEASQPKDVVVQVTAPAAPTVAKKTGAAAVKATVTNMKTNMKTKVAQVMAGPATAKIIAAVGGLGFDVTVTAEVARAGDVVDLVKADANVVIDDPIAASMGLVDAQGTLRATASVANGHLAPELDLHVGGKLSGSRLVYTASQTALAKLDGYYSAHVAPKQTPTPLGAIHLALEGIAQAGAPYGSAVIDVSNRADNTLDVVAHAKPKPDLLADLDAHVIPRGDTIIVSLGHHHLVLPGARELAGDGGAITIAPAKITADKIVTNHRGGKVEVQTAQFDRASGAIAAELDIRTLPVALVDERAQGNASGHVKVARSGRGVWKGDAHLSAANVVIDSRLTTDSTIDASIDGRRVSLKVGTTLDPTLREGTAGNDAFHLGALHGSGEVAITVEGPPDLTDVGGWFKLTRKDISVASVTLGTLDLGMFAHGATGVVDGTVLFTPVDTHGSLKVSNVTTPMGPVAGTITFDNDGGSASGLLATTVAQLEGIGSAHVDAHVAMPEHVFDPTAWAALGRHAVRAVNGGIDGIAIDDKLFARLGKDLPYHGRARVGFAIDEGISGASVTVQTDQIAGGPLVKPLDMITRTVMNATDTETTVDIFSSLPGKGAAPAVRKDGDTTGQLLHGTAKLAVTFESWLANPLGAWTQATLAGNLTIVKTSVPDLLALVGRTKDVAKGTVEGTGTLSGTLDAPIATFGLTAKDVEVPELVTGKKAPVLKELGIAANWSKGTGEVHVDGVESDGGEMHISAKGKPLDLANATGHIDIKKFDLAPLAAFAPGALVSATGIVAADLDIKGFDLAKAQINGSLNLLKGRIPIAAMVGTIRNTEATLKLTGRKGTLSVNGQLGPCLDQQRKVCRTVKLDAKGDTDAIDATLVLFHIQPITNTQPDISSTMIAHLTRETDDWHADVRMTNSSIVIPNSQGNELLAVSAPSDMVFVDALTPLVRGGVKPPPDRPYIIADVTIESTPISAEEVRGSVKGQLQVQIGGDSIGMLGIVEAEEAVVDVFNHRYQLDHGFVTFDGTTDAQLDLRLVHDFPSVTLIADVGGRISNPKLELASEPASYQEGQLLGFFLGGEPGGDPNTETRDAAAAAGSSLLSQKISQQANKVLPKAVRIDLFNCTVSSGTTTGSCTVGKWIGTKLFLAYKQHLEAPLNENQYDGQVEYYLRHDVVLEGNVGDRQYDGLDLLWRHRW